MRPSLTVHTSLVRDSVNSALWEIYVDQYKCVGPEWTTYNDNTTCKLLESVGQGTQRVTVQVVSRLVEHDQVWALPCAGGEDDLDTLATGQTTHAGVRDELSVEAEVGSVLLDLATDEGTELA
jgi:hypothetical protein